MCSGRVDLDFILRAFSRGHDGVFIGGCRLNECNYTTHGNYDALGNVYLCKKILSALGINPQRLKIDFLSAADGNLLAEFSDNFIQRVKVLGPLGTEHGMGAKELQFKLAAARKMVPYVKLVERERMRVPLKSEQAYRTFFTSETFEKLFTDLIGDKLTVSQMLLLLAAKPLSTMQISEKLGLNPAEVSKHIKNSSKHRLVRYDVGSKCYALA